MAGPSNFRMFPSALIRRITPPSRGLTIIFCKPHSHNSPMARGMNTMESAIPMEVGMRAPDPTTRSGDTGSPLSTGHNAAHLQGASCDPRQPYCRPSVSGPLTPMSRTVRPPSGTPFFGLPSWSRSSLGATRSLSPAGHPIGVAGWSPLVPSPAFETHGRGVAGFRVLRGVGPSHPGHHLPIGSSFLIILL